MASRGLRHKAVLLDCRWLGVGGAGRATELLLRGLGEELPPGRWLLWGPPGVRRFLWGRAEWRRADHAPPGLWGQRGRLPPADVAVYLHQIRPLRPGPSITLIHDTIPLRHDGGAAARLAKRTFLLAVGRLSSRILTVSEHSRRSIERDLRIPAAKIRVLTYPVDREMAARVAALRRRLPQRNVALYVGRFAPHKNLHSLVAAYERTRFRRSGGRLLLVGGDRRELRTIREAVERRGLAHEVSVEGPCSQSKLEELYGTSRLLVMPSLEEGFGLPVWEAMTCGLPVCVSDGGALPELFGGAAGSFPARSTRAMAEAIDLAAEERPGSTPELEGPTVRDFAAAFVEEAERVAATAR